MNSIIIVFLGGGLGSVCRYLVGLPFTNTSIAFPYQTFIVNVVGSLLIGLLIGYFNTQPISSSQWKLFLVTGFCGGFTTFSTFSLETLTLMKNNQLGTAIMYMLLSLLLGLLATFIGYIIFDIKK